MTADEIDETLRRFSGTPSGDVSLVRVISTIGPR
jgi:hypothetical protein